MLLVLNSALLGLYMVSPERMHRPARAGFIEEGYECNMQVRKVYDFTTRTYQDADITTTGTVKIEDYKVIDSDKYHEAVEGYEWRTVTVLYCFGDENRRQYGVWTGEVIADYYSVDLEFEEGIPKEGEVQSFFIDYMGERTECKWFFTSMLDLSNKRTWNCRTKYSFLVPAGYDGIVMAFFNAKNYNTSPPNVDYYPAVPSEVIDEDTMFFRLK